MSISQDDVKKIAKLSRIRIEDHEIEHFTNEISGILDWVEQLQEVNTEGVSQMTSVANQGLPMRDDEVTGGNRKDDILRNAPEQKFDCFVVPKVVDAG